MSSPKTKSNHSSGESTAVNNMKLLTSFVLVFFLVYVVNGQIELEDEIFQAGEDPEAAGFGDIEPALGGRGFIDLISYSRRDFNSWCIAQRF